MDTPRFKNLQEQYKLAVAEPEKIDLLVEMAMEVRNYAVERAVELADDIVARSRAAKYRLGEGRGLNLKGWCHWRLGAYDEAQEVLESAYVIAREVKSIALEARVLNNFGYVYRDRGDLVKALTYFEKALAFNEQLGDNVARSVNLASISYVHYDLGDYDNALDFALRSLPAFEAARDVHRLTSLYHILGNIYFKKGAYEEAQRYFRENEEHTEPGTIMHALALSGMGKVYYKMGDFSPAGEYLSKALKVADGLGDVEVPISCFYYQGCIEMDEGHYRRALSHFDKAFALATEYHRRHDMMSIHETYSVLYEAMGDIPKAYHHLKTYERLKEEIFQQRAFDKLRNLQARQQLELAKKEIEVAERTAQLKQQFMANMSHEIRTPMNAIVGMTRLLLEKNPAQEQTRYLNAIRQSADNLLVIINDILDLSKIEAGKIVIERIPFSTREVLDGVRDMLLLRAEEKGIGLRIVTDDAIPARLIGDPTRLNQILINLAGNAVKFTEKGLVEVRARTLEETDGRVRIRFEVEDTGIGIAPDYVGKIFDSFTQAGSDTTRKFGGTGLGLTISKQLTDLMGGAISVTSQPGVGTVFTLELAFDVSKEAAVEKPVQMEDVTAKNRLQHTRVLLVEDNEFNRIVAEDTLKEAIEDISLDTAVNGQEAVWLVQSKPYDMVLMDVQMPVMDGVIATKTIRETLAPPASEVPIIAMTANVLQEDVAAYLEAGMNAYVSKPFQTEELLRAMSSVLKGERQAPREKPTGTSSTSTLPERVTDLQFLRGFAGGSADKVKKYAAMFLENAPRLLREIDTAVETNDLTSIKIAAHSLKPQLGYMGVKEEVSHVFLLEQTAGELGHKDKLPELASHLKRVCEKAFQELREVI
jgi:signal transduction histidine kinase/DNA-binding NarL/FixJ family response regulator/Tfp pilus assembly protein PilF